MHNNLYNLCNNSNMKYRYRSSDESATIDIVRNIFNKSHTTPLYSINYNRPTACYGALVFNCRQFGTTFAAINVI